VIVSCWLCPGASVNVAGDPVSIMPFGFVVVTFHVVLPASAFVTVRVQEQVAWQPEPARLGTFSVLGSRARGRIGCSVVRRRLVHDEADECCLRQFGTACAARERPGGLAALRDRRLAGHHQRGLDLGRGPRVWSARMSTAAPVMCGAAIDVPLRIPYSGSPTVAGPLTAARMSTPGAATSGFSTAGSLLSGPRELKLAIWSPFAALRSSVAPAIVAE
jgi:hypothetical protein